MKLDTVKNFSKWHTVDEIPKLNFNILFCDEAGLMFHTGILLKENGYMFIDIGTDYWNNVVKSCKIKYWIYMSEIDVKR